MKERTYDNELCGYAEDTAYATKVHFKSADIIKIGKNFLVIGTFILPLLTLTGFELSTIVLNSISIVSLFFSILLLLYSRLLDAERRAAFIRVGNEYLDLHKEIQIAYYDGCSKKTILKIREKLRDLNKNVHMDPIFGAKNLAKYSIEKQEEMRRWWKDGNSQ